MPHVPDQLVLWGIKYSMQCNGQLHHTQRGSQMSPRARDGFDHVNSHLIRQLRQLLVAQGFEI